jgi:predicted phosphodiesterase
MNNFTSKVSLPILFMVLIFQSCATYQSKIDSKHQTPNLLKNETPKHSFYLIGDAGNLDESSVNKLSGFKEILKKSSKDDYLIFLGDNIYPSGLVKKDNPLRAQTEQRINLQLDLAKSFKGKIVFIPGNHDWYNDGLDGLDREADYIKEQIGSKNAFLPKDGCPIASVSVSDKVQLIIVDTQWYLEDWDQHPEINTQCGQITTREDFFLAVEDEINDNQGKTVILAMHHPMFTNGSHGSFFDAKSHLFPFGSKIPFPVAGTLANQVRGTGGITVQDRQSRPYQNLMNRLEIIARRADKIVMVSGHDHNLQFINDNGLTQIVSGSGSKKSAVALGNNGIFASGEQGFAVMDVFENGQSDVHFYAFNQTEKPVFQSQIFPAYQAKVFKGNEQFPQTIKTSVYTKEETQKSEFFKSVWGNHYRALYGQEITAKVALLDTLFGGLTPIRQGGGHQTRSLKLVAENGDEYTMRALKKSAVQLFQTVAFKDKYVIEEFKNTPAERLVLDFYTASHPYAALAVTDLADAAGVLHTNPMLFYVPKQSVLGDYNDVFGDELYLIEKKIKEDKSVEAFDGADDIESTADLFERLQKDEKYKVDEKAFIRARLFDMLIGDWDRHGDQWRWAEIKQANGDRIFKPVPRDRDQAFSNFDGNLFSALRKMVGASNQFQVYDDNLKNLKWMNNAGITLDRTLLKNSTLQDWLAEAAQIQQSITDTSIQTAFSKLPNEIKGSETDEIIQKLKGRRENLSDIARRYYVYLSSLGVITATDKDDIFDVERLKNGDTRIRVYRNKDGERADLMTDKTFSKSQTKEIWLYGLDDKDIFNVTGKSSKNIKIRMIGGQNNDAYNIENGRKVTVYDYKSKKIDLIKKGNANVVLKDYYENNTFDYKKNILSSNSILPSISYNPDDGIAIGLTDVYTVKGFERNPFTQQHKINAKVFFATQGFAADYEGTFANFIGKWNFVAGAAATSDNFSQNFFGFGNETSNNDGVLGVDFNRVKISVLRANIGLKRNYVSGLNIDFKALVESFEVEDSNNRFINTFGSSIPDFFDRKTFFGVDATFNFANYDNPVSPTRGMRFDLSTGFRINTEDSDRHFTFVKPQLEFYNSLSSNRNLVLKTFAKSQWNLNDGFEFYQAANLGGEEGLRGYRFQRFTGKNSLIFGGDLRYSFEKVRINFFVPLQLGIYGGYDLGRVWVKNDASDIWHDSYGGGLWLNGADLFAATLSLFGSDDGLRFSFGLKFDF